MAYEDVITTATQSAARAIAQSVVRRETTCAQTDPVVVVSRLDPVADATLIVAFKKECARQKANAPGTMTPVSPAATRKLSTGTKVALAIGIPAAAYGLYRIFRPSRVMAY